jgi:hypothetical protein
LELCTCNDRGNEEECNINGRWVGKEVRDGGGCLELDRNGYMKNVITDIIACIVFGSSYEEGRKVFQQQHALVNLVRKR